MCPVFLDLFWGALSGRVLFEVLSDFQLVVYVGECTQIFWIRFGGHCRAGCCLRCRLLFVSVRRFFGFVVGGNRFLQCNDAKNYFVFAAALLHKVDLVMLSMQKMKFTV